MGCQRHYIPCKYTCRRLLSTSTQLHKGNKTEVHGIGLLRAGNSHGCIGSAGQVSGKALRVAGILHTGCLGVVTEAGAYCGGHEGPPGAVEAPVLALHVIVAEAAHAHVDRVAARAPILRVTCMSAYCKALLDPCSQHQIRQTDCTHKGTSCPLP